MKTQIINMGYPPILNVVIITYSIMIILVFLFALIYNYYNEDI